MNLCFKTFHSYIAAESYEERPEGVSGEYDPLTCSYKVPRVCVRNAGHNGKCSVVGDPEVKPSGEYPEGIDEVNPRAVQALEDIAFSLRALVRLKHHQQRNILGAPSAPFVCPWCGARAADPKKDEKGLWTWRCHGGCNP